MDYRLDSAQAIAAAMHAQWALGLPGGMVVANPIPPEAAMERGTIDRAIAQALQEAARQGISGKASTPFLLARVNDLTGGDSLTSNTGLVLNNARLASAIALAYAAISN